MKKEPSKTKRAWKEILSEVTVPERLKWQTKHCNETNQELPNLLKLLTAVSKKKKPNPSKTKSNQPKIQKPQKCAF